MSWASLAEHADHTTHQASSRHETQRKKPMQTEANGRKAGIHARRPGFASLSHIQRDTVS